MEQFIKAVMLKAGKEVLRHYGTKLKLHRKGKGVNDIYTDADINSEKIITTAIRKRFPDHVIVGEEGVDTEKEKSSDFTWYIDPLDGTRNFIRNVPLFGIIVGVAYKGKLKYGAVYLPYSKEFCFAEKGKGARLNGKRIHCSLLKDFTQSYGIGPVRLVERSLAFAKLVAERSEGNAWVSAIASPAVSSVYVADGRRDWYYSPGSKVWDYAGSVLILQEAGCIVTGVDGKPWSLESTGLVAANKHLHHNLIGSVLENA